jgi:hypothetical protein
VQLVCAGATALGERGSVAKSCDTWPPLDHRVSVDARVSRGEKGVFGPLLLNIGKNSVVIKENYWNSIYYVNKMGSVLFPSTSLVIDRKICGWYAENYEK